LTVVRARMAPGKDDRKVAVIEFLVSELTLPGDIGQFKSEMLRFINENRPHVVVMDWTKLHVASTDSFGVLLAVHRRLSEWQGEVRLCKMNPLLSDGFKQCGLSQIFQMYSGLEEALAGRTGK
jgi:anti-anti-sigma factor